MAFIVLALFFVIAIIFIVPSHGHELWACPNDTPKWTFQYRKCCSSSASSDTLFSD
jgi:hypothetical protein